MARFDLDRRAQPGFAGVDYRPGGLLLIGINPANGDSSIPAARLKELARVAARWER